MKIETKEALEETYKLLYQQVYSLLDSDDPLITSFSNIVAALKQTFSKISWVGFYFALNDNLYLGPFQGKVACTRIKIGKGVCGTSAETQLTQVVPNVHDFPGHIACDVESNSEIVVPLFNDNNVYGVLDLDSTEFSAFDETDKIWLEKISKLITDNLDLTQKILI